MNNAMNEQELLLKTAFACMACDGEIAPSEVERIRNYAINSDRFTSLNVEDCLKQWVEEINLRGVRFLRDYVMTLRNSHVSEQQALDILQVAVDIELADERVDYFEIRFFKIIRENLPHFDDEQLQRSIKGITHHFTDKDVKRDYLALFNSYFKNINLPNFDVTILQCIDAEA